MRKSLALALLAAAILPGLGCSSLQYEERRTDGGVISYKPGDREAAITQLKKDYGDVAIEAEYDAKATKTAAGEPAGAFDPTAPVKPSDRVAAATDRFSNMLGRTDDKMHLRFSKKAGGGVTPAGLPPAPKDDLMQAGYKSSVSSYDRKPSSTALPTPNLGGPVQGVVDCADGTCTTGK